MFIQFDLYTNKKQIKLVTVTLTSYQFGKNRRGYDKYTVKIYANI